MWGPLLPSGLLFSFNFNHFVPHGLINCTATALELHRNEAEIALRPEVALTFFRFATEFESELSLN